MPSLLEIFAVVTSAACTWLLARNKPLGWWIGLAAVAAYAVVFYQVRLYAEVGIQVVYFVTSLQAIYLWLYGGPQKHQRPVSHVPRRWLGATLVVAVVATWALYALLVAMRGAAPVWDAITAVMSLVAHVYLMGRYVESWYVWIAVDVIYVPLYASRGLMLTAVLYAAFLLISIHGLMTFRRIYREQQVLPGAPQPAAQ